jgi:hypothetical protein
MKAKTWHHKKFGDEEYEWLNKWGDLESAKHSLARKEHPSYTEGYKDALIDFQDRIRLEYCLDKNYSIPVSVSSNDKRRK